MSRRRRAAAPPGPGSDGRKGWPTYVAVALSIFLGWQAVRAAVVTTGAPEAAVKLAPASPLALSRAAEAEFKAGRLDNAAWLARRSLEKAPFQASAARTLALTFDRRGESERADALMTLAGNWSLRDDAAHGWLVQRRLSVGDYGSAFAHADVLARRRPDGRERIFALLSTASIEDPRARRPLATLLGAAPVWRAEFLHSLKRSDDGLALGLGLAAELESGPSPLSDAELGELYGALASNGRFDALRSARDAVGRPDPSSSLVDPAFSGAPAPRPFGWRYPPSAGLSAVPSAGADAAAGAGLRVGYDGFSPGVFAEQLLLLAPGAYRFAWTGSYDHGDAPSTIAWRLTCIGGAPPPMNRSAIARSRPGERRAMVQDFVVPDGGCPAQMLGLIAVPGERRSETSAEVSSVSLTGTVRSR